MSICHGKAPLYPAVGKLCGNVGSWLGIAILLLAAILQEPQPLWGQVVPLEDVVPLAELEIRADDLVRVTTTYADAVREMKTAELSVKTLQALRPSATVTNLEMQIASINLKTAEQKVKILRAIAENLLLTAQAKRDFLKRMEENEPSGATTTPQASPRLARAEATVRILQMILEIQ